MIRQTTKTQRIKESPLFWPAYLKEDVLYVLNETELPQKMEYLKVRTPQEAVDVIKTMKTRAFGQFLVVLNTFLLELNRYRDDFASVPRQKGVLNRIKKIAQMLNQSRPTFPFAEVTGIVVHWAEEAFEDGREICVYVSNHIEGYLKGIYYHRLQRVQRIADIIKDGDSILTHCNVSGELAMAAHLCQKEGKDVHFFATETRPYFQGAKLTVWELKRMGAQVTLIADNAIGSVMADGLVNKVIVGSDRSCANGDFANKIGTYPIAVLADEFKIPFYVLTQPSKKVKRGEDIPIEIRESDELLEYLGRRIIQGTVEGFYPGFDVVPHQLKPFCSFGGPFLGDNHWIFRILGDEVKFSLF